MAVLPTTIYRLSEIAIKISMTFFTEIAKKNEKIKQNKTKQEVIWKHTKCQIAKSIGSKWNNSRNITIPDFKLYRRAVCNKNPTALTQNRHKDQ